MPSEDLITAQKRSRNGMEIVFENLLTLRTKLQVVAQDVSDLKEYYGTVDDRLEAILTDRYYIKHRCSITRRKKA